MNTKETGYIIQDYSQPVKRYCQTLELKEDAALIAQYVTAHDRKHSWSDIREGIRSVGILEMEIYIHDNHLFMIVETPLNFNWQEAMAQLAKLPRQEEWEAFVSQFQKCAANAASGEKWQLMNRMFYLYEDDEKDTALRRV
ncbi:L-rhamnose mutarotase [Xylanibacter muris]|uniref:L-rhamnose mutarotase n=1 Tax=Xylanibacter muris TaxID=2736290 RepID=A0ABX2ARP0_9BACT|nr:L-rhamnose mutarotase [Xylanibacter muris]NPD92907.1 L-rhamnose mutarotase [Xylanibacter muris]